MGVHNPYFLPKIIHINEFLNEAECNSSTDNLLHGNSEFFSVKIRMPFFLSVIPYNIKRLHPTFPLVGKNFAGGSCQTLQKLCYH